MRRLALAGLGVVLSLGIAAPGPAAEPAAQTKSVTGTLEDSFCYTTMGAHGASHKKCAVGCAGKGIPVMLLEKGTNKSYIVLPPKNDEPVPKDVIDKMEDEVTITGKAYEKDGTSFITAESVK